MRLNVLPGSSTEVPTETVSVCRETQVPMFRACAVGVAMGNASDDLKVVATMITEDVEDDGLAKSFSSLDLIGAQ